MGLKILHSADWHLDSPFTGFSREQRSVLKKAQKQLPGKITDLCLREDCDMMLLSGDIFDGEVSIETLEILKYELKRSGVPVLIAPGNHDFCEPGSPWLEERWPENVFIFTGGMETVTISGLHCQVYGAGYQSMDSRGLLEGFRAEGKEKYQIALLHGDPTQKHSPYSPITAPQVRASGLHYLALGHIHKAGAFRSGKTLCAWPGCPMGRGWDETGEKGVCIVTIEDSAQLQAVSLDTLRFQEYTLDIGSDPAAALENLLPAGGSEDFFRVTLTGYGQVDEGKLMARFSDYPNLQLRDQTREPVDLWAEADEDTLEGVYFRMLRQAMEEDPENAGKIRLAAEISRKLLDGGEVTL